MQTQIIAGPVGIPEAWLGIGLSYGLTSTIHLPEFLHSDKLNACQKVAWKLAHQQGGHNKFLESIILWLDVDAPRYWWQEFDTYRVGVTKQSESTIHTIMNAPLTPDDIEGGADYIAYSVIEAINDSRKRYATEQDADTKEDLFMQVKTSLPEGLLQRRIVCLNCKSLQNMYYQRHDHRLAQWYLFFADIYKDLEVSPYADDVRYYIFKENRF